jgi:hypothetical protein
MQKKISHTIHPRCHANFEGRCPARNAPGATAADPMRITRYFNGLNSFLMSVTSVLPEVGQIVRGGQWDAPLLGKGRQVERDSRAARFAGDHLRIHRRSKVGRCAQGHADETRIQSFLAFRVNPVYSVTFPDHHSCNDSTIVLFVLLGPPRPREFKGNRADCNHRNDALGSLRPTPTPDCRAYGLHVGFSATPGT